MTSFLVTFRPLVNRKAGRAAAECFGLPPFIDGSCRREPDLESPVPSISALCRGRNFAPRLQVGDLAVYLTTKSSWGGHAERHWRLVAVLRVRERFENHVLAAAWYQAEGLPLPSNCWVEGNPPIPYGTDRPGLSLGNMGSGISGSRSALSGLPRNRRAIPRTLGTTNRHRRNDDRRLRPRSEHPHSAGAP